MRWRSVVPRQIQKKRWRKIRAVLIGILTIVLLLQLCSCANHAEVVQIPPINCINEIKTPADTVNCLKQYDIEYSSLRNEIFYYPSK